MSENSIGMDRLAEAARALQKESNGDEFAKSSPAETSPLSQGLGSFQESEVRNWRIEIDALIDAAKIGLTPGREISLCHTSLQKAKAWLGETLKAIGTENPYPKSSDPSSPVIEPQAEHGLKRVDFSGCVDHLARVKHLRSLIESQISEMKKYRYGNGHEEKAISEMNLREAKHWLGWELDRIFNLPPQS